MVVIKTTRAVNIKSLTYLFFFQFLCMQKSHLKQHEATNEHKQKSRGSTRQTNLHDMVDNNNNRTFNKDLCEALVSANIPWAKLDVPKFKDFLKKYCNRNIPCESTLRKNYLPECYNETLEQIRFHIGDNSIWISVDESTDKKVATWQIL